MTVNTEHAYNEWTGDGSTTSFNFTFAVIPTDPGIDFTIDDVLLTTGISILPNSNQSDSPGGTILLSVAPALNTELVARRSTSQTQVADFPLESQLNTEKLELALDKAFLCIQDVKHEIDRRSFLWRGEWDSTKTYNSGDVVKRNGGTYIAIATSLNSAPPSSAWEEFIPRGLTWQGVWDIAANYLVSDVVESNGSSYVAIAAHTGDQPPSANWELLAQGGAAGNFTQVSVDAGDSPVTCLPNRTYIVDTSAGDVTLNTPAVPAAQNGIKFKHKVGGNDMIIDAGSDTIDGVGSFTSSVQGELLEIEWDGTDWMVV
jgi:hypothetical protein